MATKKEWEAHVKEREAWEKLYTAETKELEKKVKKMPEDGEMSTADAGLETPPPPKNP
jgi:hypothetical protein